MASSKQQKKDRTDNDDEGKKTIVSVERLLVQ